MAKVNVPVINPDAVTLSDNIGICYEDAKSLIEGSWEESDVVYFLKQYLRTPAQKKILDDLDYSIDDMMNGRIEMQDIPAIDAIFIDWNTRMGIKFFVNY